MYECPYHHQVEKKVKHNAMEKVVPNKQALTYCTSLVCSKTKTWLALLLGSQGCPAQTRCHLG